MARRSASVAAVPESEPWWAVPVEDLVRGLSTGDGGLSRAEVARRLEETGPNLTRPRVEVNALSVLIAQFRSPIILILVFAALVSAVVAEWVDAVIILVMVVGSAVVSFFQEYRASSAVAELQARVEQKATVRREGSTEVVPAADLVPGDVVVLATGGLVPADGRVLSATDCYVSEAILTGETFPVEKQPGLSAAGAPLVARDNALWMGTSVQAGTAEMVVCATGLATVYGGVAQRLALRPPETAFERGISQFGYLLTRVMLVLVLVVFAANVFLDRPPVDSLLFAIALAVGIAPELLPAIVSITLARGAHRMAGVGVIVRRLNAIENLGSMEILCTDKTGTLTEGRVRLEGGYRPDGSRSDEPVVLAAVNARLQAGLVNPLDEAILADASPSWLLGWEKVGEIPFDFFRKRMSVVARSSDGDVRVVCKGAFERVLEVCTRVGPEPSRSLDDDLRHETEARFAAWSGEGWRVLGVAVGRVDGGGRLGPDCEADMTLVGMLRFADPPKADGAAVVADLRALGVETKIISGDVAAVTAHLAAQVGIPTDRILTGTQLNTMTDEALWHAAERTDLFVEVDPTHKERVVAALQRTGRVVGFMGDGVNDAPALHAADVGISVDGAVDVAREAAALVLLRHDLGVLRQGIVEGRRTFANTLKYITTTESANFGNMLSMAAASFFLPFLPLLASQVILNNFLSDFPATTIATDRVDPEIIARPERWDMAGIRRFMIVFGLVSSVFDFVTFALLLWAFSASAELFRTGWFVESLLTELVIALVVRTRRPFLRSRPGGLLLVSTASVTALTFALPFLPFAELLGFVTPPASLVAALVGITALYVAATETAKRMLYRTAGAAAAARPAVRL